MYQIIAYLYHRSVTTMAKAMSAVKYYPLFQVVLNQKLLDDLYHFLVTPSKTGTSQAYSDLSFIVFHEHIQIIVSKITIKSAPIRKKPKFVVKFA
jgi:hypothetical protein